MPMTKIGRKISPLFVCENNAHLPYVRCTFYWDFGRLQLRHISCICWKIIEITPILNTDKTTRPKRQAI